MNTTVNYNALKYNQGIKKASYEYICFLNNDTMVLSGWDKSLINA